MRNTAIVPTVRRSVARRLARGLAAGGLLLVAGCGSMMGMMHTDVARPPASEFGFGPRASGGGLYRATLEPGGQVRVGRMQTMRLQVRDAAGQPLDRASIAIDGGMPQHGHGLPTRPRVTTNHGNGVYEVEGMRFNMGGWWVVKFRIDSAAGADSVVFNLDL
jgi:hypothetical protein